MSTSLTASGTPTSLYELHLTACRALHLDPLHPDVTNGLRDAEIDHWINQSDLLPEVLEHEAARQAERAAAHAALPEGERFVLDRWWMTDRQLRDARLEYRRAERRQRNEQ